MDNRKLYLLLWGLIAAVSMLIIGIGGLFDLHGNSVVSIAKICVLPTLIMFAITLWSLLKTREIK